MAAIPVIDLAPYSLSVPVHEVDPKALQELGDELCKAFTTFGFVYLKNHGIPQNIVSLSTIYIYIKILYKVLFTKNLLKKSIF